MSQQQIPAPNQPPNRGPIFLWSGIILFLAACVLFLYASVTKQDFIISVIAPVLTILGLFLSILSYRPKIVPQLRQSMKTGLLVFLVLFLIASLTLNVYLLIRLGTSSNPNAKASSQTSPIKTPTQAHLTPTLTATPTETQPAVPTLVQKTFFAESQDSNTSTVTFPLSVTAGDLIVVAITHFQGPVSGVVDNHGNTYTQVTEARHANTSSDYTQLYYARNVTGGTTTITSPAGGNVGIYEYSGLDKTSPLDQVTSSIGQGVTPNGGMLNTAKDNELYFAVGVDDNGGNVPLSAGSGYTLENQQIDSTHHERFYAEDRISAQGSYPTDFSITVGSHWAVIGASFKPA